MKRVQSEKPGCLLLGYKHYDHPVSFTCDRNETIFYTVMNGMKMSQIAKILNISHERVRQIFNREWKRRGLPPRPHGMATTQHIKETGKELAEWLDVFEKCAELTNVDTRQT